MRETRVYTWCDPHYVLGEEVTGKAHTIGSGNQWFTLDLCDDHRREVLEPLAEFFAEYGVRETSGVIPPSVIPTGKIAPPKAEYLPIEMPDLPTPPTATADTVDTVDKKRYDPGETMTCWFPGCTDTSRRDKLAKHFRVAHSIDKTVLMTYCPACEMDVSVMNVHSKSVHDMRVDDLYAQVVAAGDPHKAVAKRLEAAKI